MRIRELNKILSVLTEEEYMGENLGDVMDEIQKYNSLNDVEMKAATVIVVRKMLETKKIYAGNEFQSGRLVKWQHPIEDTIAQVENVWEKKEKGEISEFEFFYAIWFEFEDWFLKELNYENIM